MICSCITILGVRHSKREQRGVVARGFAASRLAIDNEMVLIGSDWATTQAVQIWAVQICKGSGRLDE